MRPVAGGWFRSELLPHAVYGTSELKRVDDDTLVLTMRYNGAYRRGEIRTIYVKHRGAIRPGLRLTDETENAQCKFETERGGAYSQRIPFDRGVFGLVATKPQPQVKPTSAFDPLSALVGFGVTLGMALLVLQPGVWGS